MTDNLFPKNPRWDNYPAWMQERMMRTQLVDDNAYRVEILRVVYEAGPKGLLMRKLMQIGIDMRWWQDTVGKHFGEKMRTAWSFGLLVVPDTAGSLGTQGKRVVHPMYFTAVFDDRWLQESWATLDRLLRTFMWVKPNDK